MRADLRYVFAGLAATAAFTFLAPAFPNLSRVVTVPALIGSAGLTLYFLWPEIRDFHKDRRVVALIGMIVCAIGFAGFAGWYFWPKADGSQLAEPQALAAANGKLQPASLFFEWKWARLPTVMPASGIIMTMPNNSKAEFGGQPIYLSPRPGTPGEKVGWSEDTRTYAGVYLCNISNYSDFPIFNLAMTFKTQFFPIEKDAKNPDAGKSSDTPIESYDRPIIINKLDPKETYSFYAYSDSRMYLHISLPDEVTYLRDGVDHREIGHLMPQPNKIADLFPMIINEPKIDLQTSSQSGTQTTSKPQQEAN